MPAPYAPIAIAGLAAGQSAFQLDSGEKVVIETTQAAVGVDPHNVTSDAHVAIRLRAWQIADDGSPILTTDPTPKPVGPPDKWYSILSSALAEGIVSLDNELVTYTTETLDRMRTWLVVRQQILRIPQAT